LINSPYNISGIFVSILVLRQSPSSLVENLNSQLRQYFFLRRQIGHGYLDLLRFYFNHRRYERSLRPERTGYSPAELMTGEKHPHWLEILGFKRFEKQLAH